jgi:hypothetical protein
VVVAHRLSRRSTVVGLVVTGPLGGGWWWRWPHGELASKESGSASLAPSLGARVPVGQPRGPIQIRVVCLYNDLGGVDSGTGMTSIGSTCSSSSPAASSSSSSSMTSISPSPSPGDENTGCHCATGYGHGLVPWTVHGSSR